MMDDKQQQEAVDFLLACMNAQGVACSTVSDGHILMFKRSHLQAILDANPDNEEFVIFIKRPDMQ